MDIRKVIFWRDDWRSPPPLTAAPFLPEAHTSGWPWWLPRLAFVLFIAAVITLLALSRQAEHDEQRATLISDILWLEQNLSFQFVRNEEQLSRIPPQAARQASTSTPRRRSTSSHGP